jgi:serine/threonine protein kinase
MVGEDDRVVITDFGISKALEAGTQYTSVGQIVGTPRYLSPEQAAGEAIDGRADQYSLAVAGYELLTGQLPLGANTVHALLYAHINEVPRAAREIRPEIPSHVSDALSRALAKRPAERFGTMEEFATALWPDRPVSAMWTPTAPSVTPTEPSPQAGPPVAVPSVETASTRMRRRLGIAGALAVLVAAGVLSISHRGRPALRPEAPDTIESAVRESVAGPTNPVPGATPPVPARPESTVSSTAPDSGFRSTEPRPADEKRPEARAPARKRPAAVTRTGPESAGTAGARPAAPAAPTTGYLTINAVPYGTVSIDGLEIGDTPLVRYGVSPGQHTFTITREGFRTDSGAFTVTAGNEVRMRRTLTKASP